MVVLLLLLVIRMLDGLMNMRNFNVFVMNCIRKLQL